MSCGNPYNETLSLCQHRNGDINPHTHDCPALLGIVPVFGPRIQCPGKPLSPRGIQMVVVDKSTENQLTGCHQKLNRSCLRDGRLQVSSTLFVMVFKKYYLHFY